MEKEGEIVKERKGKRWYEGKDGRKRRKSTTFEGGAKLISRLTWKERVRVYAPERSKILSLMINRLKDFRQRT